MLFRLLDARLYPAYTLDTKMKERGFSDAARQFAIESVQVLDLHRLPTGARARYPSVQHSRCTVDVAECNAAVPEVPTYWRVPDATRRSVCRLMTSPSRATACSASMWQ